MAERKQPYFNEYYVLADGLNDYISLGYSFGWPVAQLVAPGNEMLKNYTLSIDPDVDYSDGGGLIYADLLEIIAKGVLLNANDALGDLAGKLKAVGYHDYLISFLLRFAVPAIELMPQLQWSQDVACLKLREITLSERATASDSLMDYLQNYFYTSDNLEDDYGSHKRNDNSYTGYWSFESAAIAKIMGLNDDSLENHPYYPYDLRHGDNRSIDNFPSLSEFMPVAEQQKREPIDLKVRRSWWKFW